MDILSPKVMIRISSFLHVWQALSYQLSAAHSIELETALFCLGKILIICSVAKRTRRNYELWIIPFQMSLRKEVIPSEAKPIFKRQSTVQSAILAFELVSLVCFKCISP